MTPSELRALAKRIVANRPVYAPTDPPVYVGHGPVNEQDDDVRLARAVLAANPAGSDEIGKLDIAYFAAFVVGFWIVIGLAIVGAIHLARLII